MVYYILQKIEYVSSEISYSEIGYITDSVKADSVNTSYDGGLGGWFNTNKDDLAIGSVVLSDWFTTTPVNYHARKTVNYIPEGLTEITDVTPYS